jgi:hypothetical protein
MRFRSKFEKTVYEAIPKRHKRRTEYEPNDTSIHYTLPKRYIPDFVLPNGIHVECKGYFQSGDRTKMLRVGKENPHLDIRFVFQRANNRLTKSKNSMMYWEWAEKHGFDWAEGKIPERWFNE